MTLTRWDLDGIPFLLHAIGLDKLYERMDIHFANLDHLGEEKSLCRKANESEGKRKEERKKPAKNLNV